MFEERALLGKHITHSSVRPSLFVSGTSLIPRKSYLTEEIVCNMETRTIRMTPSMHVCMGTSKVLSVEFGNPALPRSPLLLVSLIFRLSRLLLAASGFFFSCFAAAGVSTDARRDPGCSQSTALQVCGGHTANRSRTRRSEESERFR